MVLLRLLWLAIRLTLGIVLLRLRFEIRLCFIAFRHRFTEVTLRDIWLMATVNPKVVGFDPAGASVFWVQALYEL